MEKKISRHTFFSHSKMVHLTSVKSILHPRHLQVTANIPWLTHKASIIMSILFTVSVKEIPNVPVAPRNHHNVG